MIHVYWCKDDEVARYEPECPVCKKPMTVIGWMETNTEEDDSNG